MLCFLNVLTTFCKEISEIINAVIMIDLEEYEDQEIQHQKKENILLRPHFQKYFFLIGNVIITERLNIHCSRIT